MKYIIFVFSLMVGYNASAANILLVGDSFVHKGYGRYVLTAGSLVNTTCPLLADNTASGNNMGNSARLAACASTILAGTHWDYVVFNAGMHDVHIHNCLLGETAHQVELSDHENNLQTFIDAIIAQGGIPIFVTTTPVENRIACHSNTDIIAYNHADKLMMDSQGIMVCDLYTPMRPVEDQYHLPENIHFTQAGYQFLGNIIEGCLASIGLK